MSDRRGSWGSWFEFFFTALGTLVGLGNVWRFPYICYRNGGGAFLLPFFISLAVYGAPIMLLEMAIGQYSNLGPGRLWIVCPLFKGLGFSMTCLVSVVSIYYTLIMAWTMYYVVMSFRSTLPWTTCGNAWNSDRCWVKDVSSQEGLNDSLISLSLPPRPVRLDGIPVATFNSTTTLTPYNVTSTSWNASSYNRPQDEFWFKGVLNISTGMDEFGDIQWHILLCHVITWVLVFVCLSRGIKSLGKVAYAASSLPYVLLLALLVRGCMLPGAGQGLAYFITPSWGRLLDTEVWRNAATQTLYSIGVGGGVLSTLASYNKFHNNCLRDAVLLPVLDGLTSVFAGLVIFTFLGYMAHSSGVSVGDVVDGGPGLVFITYPTALSTLPCPQLWSVLFFLMLFVVGLNSQFLHVQHISTALADCFPNQLMGRRTVLTLGVCLVCLLMGLPFTTRAGVYLLNLVDWYIGGASVLVMAMTETTVLAWVYGVNRLYEDLQAMFGYRPVVLWKFAWKYVVPVLSMVVLVTAMVNFKHIGAKNPGYPAWSSGLGLAIIILNILPIPVKMVWTLLQLKGTLVERIRQSVRPSEKWKPSSSTNVTPEELKALA